MIVFKDCLKFDKSFVDNLKSILEEYCSIEFNVESLPSNYYTDVYKFYTDEDNAQELWLELFVQTIVIKRINLSLQRQGIFTKVFEKLKEYAENNGVRAIEIWGVCTREMSNWCKKHEFEPPEWRTLEYEDYICGDFRLSIQ